jgi:hypothetical protein
VELVQQQVRALVLVDQKQQVQSAALQVEVILSGVASKFNSSDNHLWNTIYNKHKQFHSIAFPRDCCLTSHLTNV